MTERDDSTRRAGESAGLSVSDVETDTQTEAAEVLSDRECDRLWYALATTRCGPCHADDGWTPGEACESCGDMAHDLTPYLSRIVESLLSARVAAAEARGVPWAKCTGASDCPEEWHVHGCYADTGQCDDPLDHPTYADGAQRVLAAFVEWVAVRRAYNGAGDPGQALYDYGLNAVLPKWADEFAAARAAATGGGS